MDTQKKGCGIPRSGVSGDEGGSQAMPLANAVDVGLVSFGCLRLDQEKQFLYPDNIACQILGITNGSRITPNDFLVSMGLPALSQRRRELMEWFLKPWGGKLESMSLIWTGLICGRRQIGAFPVRIPVDQDFDQWILIIAELFQAPGDRWLRTEDLHECAVEPLTALANTWEYFPASEIMVWTPEWSKLFGISETRSVLTLKEWGGAIHEADFEAMQNTIRGTLLRQEQHWSAELRLKRPNSNVRWICLSGYFIYDQTGIARRGRGVSFDITSQKERQISLSVALDNARRSQEGFLSQVGHEVNHAASAICGHVSSAVNRINDQDAAESIDAIRRDTTALVDIVNEIIDHSKIEAGRVELHPEYLRLDLLLGDLYQTFSRRTMEKGLTFIISCHTPVPEWIETDSIRLRQILVYLISSAIEFTDRGSVVTYVYYKECEAMLFFDVVDSGADIADADHPELFTLFGQTGRSSRLSGSSSGVGLPISRRLAEALGGNLSLHGREGAGNIFTLSLPCDVCEPRRFFQTTLPGCRPDHVFHDDGWLNATILIVDPGKATRILVQRILEKSGATVMSVADGQAAADLLCSSSPTSELVDVVLMDMNMPDLDGHMATQLLRQVGFNKPIIALITNSTIDERRRCLESGCADYLSKPIDSRRLVLLIRRLLNQW